MSTISVATWNICHGSLPGARDPGADALTQAVVSLGADIVAIQEIERSSMRSGFVDQITAIAGALGTDRAFARTTSVGGVGDYGIAMFATAIQGSDVVWLTRHGTAEPRVAIDTRVDTTLGPIRVIGTHVSRDPAERRTQLDELITLARTTDGPLVMMGDFNTRPEEALILFEQAGLTAAETGPTYLGDRSAASTIRIDYIAVRALRILQAEVLVLPISDHAAVRATLALP